MGEENQAHSALDNMREFQEMSYADVYAMICEKRFEEAKIKYKAVYETLNYNQFDAALDINITTSHDEILEFMSNMAGKVDQPEKIRAVGFDLSSHALYENEGQICDQGIEVNLYSEDVYDFLGATDEELKEQCQGVSSAWQGSFMDIATMPLKGLGSVARQFYDFEIANQDGDIDFVETADGNMAVNPIMIARHVAKLLLAIEYHQFMAKFVEQVEVPSQMIFIIGEHDEIEVPITFYRVGEDEPVTVVLEEIETPPIYQETGGHDEKELMPEQAQEVISNDEPVVSSEAEITSEQNLEVASDEKQQIADQVEQSDQQEDQEDDVMEQTPAIDHDSEEFDRVMAKDLIGLPLKSKTFGQRTNHAMNAE